MLLKISIHKMATFIKLEPMRMGDLLKNTEAPISGKYVPPSRRTASDSVDKIDMGVKNFPSLGAAPKKPGPWGKEPSTAANTGPSLSDKIKEKIRLDALEEEEKARVPESDVWKMTAPQLYAAGWNILSLGETRDPEDNRLLRTYSYSPHGLSFYDYSYYLSN